MRVLLVASEAAPFSKTGGLGDVVGSLPLHLKKLGVDVSVILPKYQDIPHDLKMKMKWIRSITVPVGWRNQFCGVEILCYQDINFYFIDNQYYFYRDGLYGYDDDAERFAFFSRSVLEILPHIDCKPDIIHNHDWQTAMVSYLLKTQYQHYGFYKHIKTVFTIHNLKYQGIFPKEVLGDLFNGSLQHFNEDGLEYNGNVNYMKGGLNFSDFITTVSPTYAKEIQSPFFGEGLEGVLAHKNYQLVGITNGIDDCIYNPQTNRHLFKNYSDTSIKNKEENKLGLQERLNLPIDAKIPMIGMVTRLVEQKGLDLVENQLEKLMEEGVQLVVLGTGDDQYEELFRQAARKYPNQMSTNLFFDEVLAHQIYGGSDFFLMPSMFEPCGLGQLIALRYGTIPIVRETGGLKDTVKPYDEISKKGNGLTFVNYNAHDMFNTIKEGFRLYQDKEKWNQLVKNAINTKVGWEESAKAYLKLYQSLR